jgi:hypothetical protein
LLPPKLHLDDRQTHHSHYFSLQQGGHDYKTFYSHD